MKSQQINMNHKLSLLLCVIFYYGTHCSMAQSICSADEMVTEDPMNLQRQLYQGQDQFTMTMLEAIHEATPNENIFFSPYSTYHALLLAYFGSNGNTEAELTKALGLDWAKNKKHVSNAYHLEKQLRLQRFKQNAIDFSTADKIYFDSSINILQCMTDIFGNELQSLNFREDVEKCRSEINTWIANTTKNQIIDMLKMGDITADTQMVLANAAYFKGQWLRQFDVNATRPEIFYISKNEHTFVPMMHQRGVFNLAIDEQLGAHILTLPYTSSHNDEVNDNTEISMIIILPPFVENGFEKVLEKLKPSVLEMALKSSMPREMDVSLPKFNFEQNIELVPILKRMGIKSMFEPDADLSNFSVENKLIFGDAKHVAKIKVDEEGSIASAATVLFSFRSARPDEPTKFECNHPFLFLIYDHMNKAILFIGIYRDPKTLSEQIN